MKTQKKDTKNFHQEKRKIDGRNLIKFISTKLFLMPEDFQGLNKIGYYSRLYGRWAEKL